ncbi:MAG: DNA methyltransferase [Anaerolineae bacterium]
MSRKHTAAQPTLFRRDIPKMPDGYYSSGPNPNLRRFVEEHARPYDPETDDYDVPPFDRPITTTKATAIYNMHTYWSKKPHDAIREYIRHYTRPGDIVLDPFCGSGGTALAALMEGRAAIAIDLSPAATFITKNYCTPVDVHELQEAFAELQRKVKPEMDWLYATRCDRCDGRATTAYTVYSYVFRCPRCLEKVPLFDCVEVTQGPGAGGRGPGGKTIRACPHCYDRGIVEEISTRGERFDPVPVLVSYECEEGCKPKRGERRHNDPDPKKRRFFEEYDLAKIREIEAKPIPHWYPPHRMMNVESDTAPWGDEWRPGRNFRTVAELFTKRNLWALAALLHAIRSLDNDSLLFAFQSNILSGTIMQQWREAGGGFAKGTYYVPQVFIEREQLACLRRKVVDVISGQTEIASTLVEPTVFISTQSATDLSDLPSNSLDYIFTDPPYADKVQYGELNFIWEAWLGFDTHWHDREIIVNETRGITEEDWARLMRQAMRECYRVLKPGRWISLCYHDTSEGTWQLVQDIMAEVGFIAQGEGETLYIDTGQKSYNQLTADKVTRRDLVINFRKPRPGEVGQVGILSGDDATFAEKARAILRDALERHPGATADRLYDELVSRMVRRGEFERHNFEELLAQVAEPVADAGAPGRAPLPGLPETVRWYLKETSDRADEAESAREAAAAAQLEAFMKKTLGEAPKGSETFRVSEGVHYSDLFEQYLKITDKPRRLVADWLPEYFVKTPEGTWRPPADDAERAALAALRAEGTLRRIKRFANALLDGVQPAERDRPAGVADAADWLRQCRRAGLYEQGRAIYELGAFRFSELGEERALEVEEDYQVCVRRSTARGMEQSQ